MSSSRAEDASLLLRSSSAVCAGTHSSLNAIRYFGTVLSSSGREPCHGSSVIATRTGSHLFHERRCSDTTLSADIHRKSASVSLGAPCCGGRGPMGCVCFGVSGAERDD